MEDQSTQDTKYIYTDLPFTQDFEIREEARQKLERRLSETPVDTREALAGYKPVADEHQQKVIEADQTTIRVVAPAGSGKTQSVINRILYRVQNGINPSRFLVLTFDNAAATSLNKTLKTVAPTGVEDLRITTLNAFGYSILREYVPNEYKPVIPDYRQRRLLREVKTALKEKSAERYATLPSNVLDRFYLEFFSFLKNSLFDPREPDMQKLADTMLKVPQAVPFFANSIEKGFIKNVIQAVIWLFMAYERAMQRDGLLDFDDQKLRAYLSLRENTSLLNVLQNQFSEIIVDEFQDINLLDFVFIKSLAEKSKLVVVGDDDQAIYGFRGCTPDFIIDLDKHLQRPMASYELRVNYRCPPNIVTYADKLICHNKRRIEKNPIAHNKIPSEIKVVSTLSAGLEAKSIVTFIKRVMRGNRKLQYKDFVILYRTNAQSLPLQVEFILSNIPYFVREEDNILANEILERLLGVLRLKLALSSGRSPDPRDALLTIRAYFRYIGGYDADKLGRLFRREHNFINVISSEEFYSILTKARQSHLASVMSEVLDAGSLMDTLDVMTRRFHGLRGMIGSLEDVIEEKVPLGEIYEIAANFGGSTADFVKTIEKALKQARASGAGRDQEGGVSLLTYFKAKGLQWHTVILTTCNEGLIPHKRAPIEDERRLFYVAMTRATSNLLISYVKNVVNTKVEPSRFLYEAGLLTQ
jgi:DNA helicase-2/ATP-dependent DNA helicase PcrA